MRVFVLSALLAAGCSNQAPTIRMLEYTPNAGFVNEETDLNGSFDYSDADQDVSQWVVELVSPDNSLVERTPPTPGMSLGQGVTGTADFTLTFTADMTGLYHFRIWLVDLGKHESNHLTGEVRIATRDPYDNNNNP